MATCGQIGEYNVQGTMLRRYIHGSNVEADDPLVWYEGSAMSLTTRRYVHADPRGSIIAVTDRPGALLAVNSYDEYGIPDMSAGYDISTKGRFRYTGQVWIPELGMYYYKARIYSPTLGRFLQTDPIGYEDQFNLYAYVANDPVNLNDPSGEYAACALGGPTPATVVCLGGTAVVTAGCHFSGACEAIAEGIVDGVKSVGDWLFNEEADDGPDVEIPDKIRDQAGDRGWTEDDIRDTVGKGRTGTSSDGTGGKGKNPEPACVYGDKGGYVVVNDETGQVVQVSDKNDPDWIPDERIDWDD